jgi:Glycosyl transferase family 11
MITSFIGPNGRLGNQMFQYAAMVGIAAKQALSYGLDYRYGDAQPWNNFHTDETHRLLMIDKCFNLSAPHTSTAYPEFREEDAEFEFHNKFFKCGDNVMLRGRFQTHLYFEHVKDQIHREFTFKPEIVTEAQKHLINNGLETVCVHARRGDYVWQSAYNICDVDYFRRAMSHFNDKPYNVMIISEDLNWASDVLCKMIPNSTMCLAKNQFVELCIMSLCHHNIICNSTFSWWGSWLNVNPDKKVIAPKEWLRNHPHINTRDIYHPTWTLC